MAAVSHADFGFRPEGGGTQVSWVMTGTNDFTGKAFSLFADMDAMIGKDFDQGLAAMRPEAEAEAKRRAGASAAARAGSGAAPVEPATPSR